METRDLDSVEYLTSESEIAAYLKAAAEHNDDELYADCLSDVARARAINHLAESMGIERNALYEMLSEPKNIVWLRTFLVTVTPTEIEEMALV